MLEFLYLGGYLPYLGIILFLILTGAGLPIPEEVLVVAAGFLSSEHHLDWPLAYLACVLGALLGDILVYSIGRYPGHNFLRKHPWFARLLHEDREKQMEEMIKKHGLKVFFVARFMVGVRMPLYLAAGVVRMPWWRFLLINGICATTVVTLAFWLGHQYGRVVGEYIRNSQYGLTLLVVVGLVAVLIYFLIRRRRTKNRLELEKKEEESQAEPVQKVADTDRIVA
jgi:membrane protein DedA with SNARE-associated domain